MGTNTVDVTDATFTAEVLDSSKAVVVEFWASWCGPCKILAPVLDEIAGEHRDTLTVARMDVDANPATPQRYAVESIPVTLVFRGGVPVKKIVGARPKEAMLADLADFILTAPAVTAVSPAAGPAAGAPVTITGTGLHTATGVHFGGAPATMTGTPTDTTITAIAPAHPAGPVAVTVTTPSGTSPATPAGTFTYLAAPTVTAVEPPLGPVGGAAVTITGTGLHTATSARFGDVPATITGTPTDTTITAIAPAHPAGPAAVTVTAAGGTSPTADAARFTYLDRPVITAVTPASGPVTGTDVTISGTGLQHDATVQFGLRPATVTGTPTDTTLTVTAPAQTAGPAQVTVATPGGTSAVTAAGTFTYVSAPAVTAVTPAVGPVGGAPVTVNGTGLATATAVLFGDTPATGLVVGGDTALTATAPAHAAGPVPVTVTASGGTSAPTVFTYLPAPAVTAISPAVGPATGGPVTITGTGLAHATGVLFDDAPATNLTVVSDTGLTATAPARPAGPVAVTVFGPGGTSTPVPYTAVPAPTVTALSPATAPAGTAIFLTGTHLRAVTAVLFGATPGTDLSADDDTQLLVTVPPGTGALDVIAVSPGGTSSPVHFTYH